MTKKLRLGLWLLAPCCLFCMQAFGQRLTIRGRVSDSVTGEPVGFATIAVRGTSIGTTTTFDGLFTLTLAQRPDSLSITCIGYLSYRLPLTTSPQQNYNILLDPASNKLGEVRIHPGGYVNPAWAILKQVIKHKAENDPRGLLSYQFESYSRIELDAANLSENLKKKRAVDRVLNLADNLRIRDGNNMPVLPLFLSETVSDFFLQNSPHQTREIIKRTKSHGVGYQDGTLLAQLTGSTFQQFNFYKNFVSAAGKDFVSPITDNWKNFYEYELQSSNSMIEGRVCYEISFRPKRPKDLAFTGTIWITKDNYALYQIKAAIEPSVNLNFIYRTSVQQLMQNTLTGQPMLPQKTRILVEVNSGTQGSSGLLAKFYCVNKNPRVNTAFPPGFFKEKFSISASAMQKDEQFWEMSRPDSLTTGEKSVYSMIDTVKKIPIVKNYLTAADVLLNGYYRVDGLSLGPILNTYSYNDVEGSRVRVGFKTNSELSKQWVWGGYIAYGSKDQDLKYSLNVNYILSRKNWTEAGVSFSHDLNQLALLSDNYRYQRNNLFAAFTQFGQISKRKAFYENNFSTYITRDLFKGFSSRVSYSNWSVDPMFSFNFNEPHNGALNSLLVISELQLETRWSPGIQPLLSEALNRPLSIKDPTSPAFTFRYSLGLKNILGGDVSYQKITFNIIQVIKMGALGRGKYSFTIGYIPSNVKYPLLENHLGNQTFIYNPNAFNLMRFFEFGSDKYAILNYTQHFEGLVLNSIPVIRDLNWRLVGTTNVLYGGLSRSNQQSIENAGTIGLRGLGSVPYIEAGYGIENIFRFVRIDFIHRLTYRDNYTPFYPRQRNFDIKISAQLRF